MQLDLDLGDALPQPTRHWEELPAEQRTEALAALTRLLAKAALPREDTDD
jgi:hypothetical protein